MSDANSKSYPMCTYCGKCHDYSAEMCRDMHLRGGKPATFEGVVGEMADTIATLRRELEDAKACYSCAWGDLQDAKARLAALTLDNARKTDALEQAEGYVEYDHCGENENREETLEVIRAALAAPAEEMVRRVRGFARNVRAMKAGDEMPVALLQEADALLAELPGGKV